ncbi:MAG TPA: hypothetical protein DCQ63_05590 [Planktothrix sp. UBA8402]|jgi:hypothetical protein|nr:hypothetical protein [Planktothrix sp. UBA8402]
MAISLQEQITPTFDSESLVKRLREDKETISKQVHEFGFNCGVKSVSVLSYQELHRIKNLSVAGIELDTEAFIYMWDFLDNHHYQNECRLDAGELSYLLPDDDQNKLTFVKSWMEGVLSVWNQIKSEVDQEDGE